MAYTEYPIECPHCKHKTPVKEGEVWECPACHQYFAVNLLPGSGIFVYHSGDAAFKRLVDKVVMQGRFVAQLARIFKSLSPAIGDKDIGRLNYIIEELE